MKNKKKFLLWFIVIALGILLFIGLKNPFVFFTLFSSYKTQTIIYVHKNNPELSIEFQMKDIGALGYKRRIIKRNKKLFFKQETIIDTTKIDLSKWEKVNIYKNELNLRDI